MTIFDIFCDESAHLEHDGLPWMALGAVWCPHDKTREIAVRVREIKAQHGFAQAAEVKWSKVGPAGRALYLALLDYFMDDDDLHFRAVMVDKRVHTAARNGGDHDAWYYALYFDLIEPLLVPGGRFRIYLDINDTRSQEKVQALHRVLCDSQLDFDRRIVERMQQVRSHQVEQIQLADLLLGAVTYANRDLSGNAAKVAFVERLRERTGLGLTRSTLLREPKMNLYFWKPRSDRTRARISPGSRRSCSWRITTETGQPTSRRSTPSSCGTSRAPARTSAASAWASSVTPVIDGMCATRSEAPRSC